MPIKAPGFSRIFRYTISFATTKEKSSSWRKMNVTMPLWCCVGGFWGTLRKNCFRDMGNDCKKQEEKKIFSPFATVKTKKKDVFSPKSIAISVLKWLCFFLFWRRKHSQNFVFLVIYKRAKKGYNLSGSEISRTESNKILTKRKEENV